MKNILITGAFGFIGSHFTKLLLKRYDYNIVVVDKMTYAGNRKNLPSDVVSYELDINHPNVLNILVDNSIDTIVNFAAMTHVDRSIRNPKEFLDADIMGVFNLVYSSMKSKKVTRVLHISTDEVFGSIRSGFEADENFPFRPTSPYAASKASGDLLLQSYIKTYGFPAIIVRPCNQYGPNQYPEKLVPMIITRLLSRKKIILHGKGTELREWMYVEDLCNILDNILHNGVIGESYNIGSGNRFSNIEMIKYIAGLMGVDGTILPNFIKEVENRPGNDSNYAISAKKVNDLMDNKYVYTHLLNGMSIAVDWYRQNIDWWPKIDLESNIYDNENYLR